MVNGNAKKISRTLRASLPNGVNQSAVLACALAYAIPLPVDACGCLCTDPAVYYKTSVVKRVEAILSEINEIHLLEIAFTLDKVKETFLARANALCKPITSVMSVTQNFTDVEFKLVDVVSDYLTCEFNGV